MSNYSLQAHRSAILALFVLGAASCAVPGPPLEDCTYGRYHADCGGNGQPALGCDASTGECRWFLGGLVADGFITTACSSANLCCVPVGGGRMWPFADWAPTGEALTTAQADIGILGSLAVTTGTPPGVLVAYDPALAEYVAPGPLPFDVECGTPEICGFGRSEVSIRGQSLVVTLFSRSETSRTVLEVVPDSLGVLHARLFTSGAILDFEWDRTALGCAFQGSAYDIVGSMRLAPGSMEDASLAHGDLDVAVGVGGDRFHLRF